MNNKISTLRFILYRKYVLPMNRYEFSIEISRPNNYILAF